MKNKMKRLLSKTRGYLAAKDSTLEEIQSNIKEGNALAEEIREALADTDTTEQEKEIYELQLKYVTESVKDKEAHHKERAPLEAEIQSLSSHIASKFTSAKSKGKWETVSDDETENKKAINDAIVSEMKKHEIGKGLEQTEEQLKENNKLAESLKVRELKTEAEIAEDKEAMYTAWLEEKAKERREGVAKEIASAKIGADSSLEKLSEPKQEIDLNVIKWMHNKTYEVKEGDKVIGSYKKDGGKLSYNSSGDEKTDKLMAKAMVEHLLKISNPPITASGDEKLVNMVKDVCEKGTPKIDFVNGNENKAGHGMKK